MPMCSVARLKVTCEGVRKYFGALKRIKYCPRVKCELVVGYLAADAILYSGFQAMQEW